MDSGLGVLAKQIDTMFRRMGRRFRLIRANREIVLFAMFLLVAIAFWFSQTFKDHTTVNVEYTLRVVNVPKNVLFTSEVPRTVSVSLSGKGFVILQYMLTKKDKILSVDYSDLSKIGGVLSIDNYIWKKVMAKELPASVNYSSVNPSSVEIYYSMGEHRQVPVVFKGKVRTSDQHILCGLDLIPQYVDIYAPSPQYDTIKAVYTEPVTYTDVEDSIRFRVALQKMKGVKMVPDSIDINACVDLFTSKTLKVPIYCANIPQDKILRTFPLMADVSFRVSATMFSKIVADDFLVVVDFNSIKPGDSKCKLVVRDKPNGIYNVKINPEYVDYVIEQQED